MIPVNDKRPREFLSDFTPAYFVFARDFAVMNSFPATQSLENEDPESK